MHATLSLIDLAGAIALLIWGVHMVQTGVTRAFGPQLRRILTYTLVLLRHRTGVAAAVLRGALQHGHRARVVARATIRCRRIVAIEFSTCRSGRTGGASGWTILGNAKRRELIGGVVGG